MHDNVAEAGPHVPLFCISSLTLGGCKVRRSYFILPYFIHSPWLCESTWKKRGYAGAQVFLMSSVGRALGKGAQFSLQTACHLQCLCVTLEPKADWDWQTGSWDLASRNV